METQRIITSQMFQAIRTGNLTKVQELLKTYYYLNFSRPWGNGYILLQEAMIHKEKEITKYLWTKGCKVYTCSTHLKTPLHLVATNDWARAESNNTPESEAMLQIAAMEDIDFTFSDLEIDISDFNFPFFSLEAENYKGQDMRKTELHFAAAQATNSSRMNKIIECGGDVNAQDKEGNTPLHIAAYHGYFCNVEALLRHGADSNIQNRNGEMPLHIAAGKDFFAITDILIEHGAKIDVPDLKGKLPIHSAAAKGGSKTIERLIDHGAWVDSILLETKCSIRERGFTPLFLAIVSKQLSSIVQLLSSGADVNAADSNGHTVLYTAVETDQLEIVKEILNHKPDVGDKSNEKSLISAVLRNTTNSKQIVESLLEYGLTIGSENSKDVNLLFHVVKKGYIHILEQLMKEGTNANLEVHGKPLLHTALDNKQLNVAERLLEHGAVINNDLLHSAIWDHKTDFVNLFLQHGIDPNVADPNGKRALHFCGVKNSRGKTSSKIDIISKLLEHGALINTQTILGNTPLHEICTSGGSHNDVEFLCSNGAQINIRNVNGDTPLHCTAASGNTETGLFLLKHAAFIQSRNNQGKTPLHIACYKENSLMIQLLVSNGADVDSKDHDGNSPLEILLQSNSKTPLYELASSFIFKDFFKYLLGYSSKSIIHNPTKVMDLLLRLPRQAKYTFEMIFSLLGHVTLLVELGFCLDPEISKELSAAVDSALPSDLRISGKGRAIAVFAMTEVHCRAYKTEVEIMKKEKIGDSGVLFYNFLRKSCHQVAICMKETSFFEYLQQSNYKKLFPYYGNLIEIHIWKGKMRQNLLTEVNKKWHCLFEGLTFDSVQEILSYLDDVDLSALIQVFPSLQNPMVERLPSPPTSRSVQPSTSSTFSMNTYGHVW